MAFVSKIGDIVLLENDENFIVVDCIEYQGESYLKLGSVLQEKNNERYVSGFVKESVENDGTYRLLLVRDPILANTLEKIIEDVHKNI